jgi:7-cyano-7-deazaguanine synthase
MASKLVLLSGGLDSATALALALSQGSHVAALSIQYGSVHSDAEGKAAHAVAGFYDLPLEILTLPTSIFRGGNSALLGESNIPNEEYHDPEKETPSATVVPFRNANFIAAAVAQAEARGFEEVWMAVHATDHGGWAYPDCSPEFIGAMAAAVYIGTLRKVRLVAPFINMSKGDIVKVGTQLNVPYHLTWSCYRGGDLACGECPTCLERLKAFRDAGVEDPIKYQRSANV